MATRGMNQGGADSEDDDGPPRQYIGPPRPRKGTAQALIWNFMMPYSSAEGSRNVECCILVPDTDGSGMRKCGATFKHTMGGSTTNLLKHLRKKHPDEAKKCLEGSKHSNVYKKSKTPTERHAARATAHAAGAAVSDDAPSDGEPSGTAGGSDAREEMAAPRPSTSDAVHRGTNHQWETAVKKMMVTGFAPETKESVRSARNYTLYCAVDLQPCSVGQEPGHTNFLTNTPGCDAVVTNQMFDTILSDERRKIVHQIYKAMQAQHQLIPFGPFCSLQLDMWSRSGVPNWYCVATITFVDTSFEVKRLGLDVHSFAPGYKAADVRAWVQHFTSEYFSGMTPSQVYCACTVGHGEHLVEALMGLQVPIIQCCLKRLNQLVAEAMTAPHQHIGSSSSPLPDAASKGGMVPVLMRCKAVAQYLQQPNRHNASLVKVQSAIGHDLCTSELDPDSPSGTLQFLMAMLHVRPLIMEHYREVGHAQAPTPLSNYDWQTICDAVGVLEACAEVDRTVRGMHFAGLTPALVLINELQDYLHESMLFVPEPKRCLDSHRVEKRVDDLQPAMYRVRQTISEELHEQGLGHVATKQERIAAVLDVGNKEMLLHDDVALNAAWDDLSAEYKKARAHLAGGPAGDGAFAPPGDLGEGLGHCSDTKRKWAGVLTMRKEQRRGRDSVGDTMSGESAGGSLLVGEISNYRSLLQLSPTNDAEDALSWWAQHVRPKGMASTWGGTTSFPTLSLIAAQYHSIDASSTQANSLFEGVGYRVAGLHDMTTGNSIENMLFLRLNRDIIDRPII